MSLDSPVADALIETPQRSTSSSLSPAAGVPLGLLRGVSPLLFSAATLLTGAAIVVAVATGANLALSLFVGYASFAATIAVLRTSSATAEPREALDVIEPTPLADAQPTTTAAWKLVTTFTVSDASRLLCNVEPGAAATQESIAWGRALLDAIKAGDLAIAVRSSAAPGMLERERENPHYMTEITREALHSWADQKGSVPEFLRA